MKLYGTAAAADFLGDHIVFRKLRPVRPDLPGLDTLRGELGFPSGLTPRKTSREYARVIHRVLIAAHPRPIQRLVYLGDTLLNDGSAFANLCEISGWSGWAFIGADCPGEPPAFQVSQKSGQYLLRANRWSMLDGFSSMLRDHEFVIDQHTAVVIDLDKTTLGARGRNDAVIDQARIRAAARTGAEVLGDRFDSEAFTRVYQVLNQPEYHPLTADNQDFLVYVCLMALAEVYPFDALTADYRQKRLNSFDQFHAQISQRTGQMPAALRGMHAAFSACLAAGDPTPFKAFREFEYENTVQAMNNLADHASMEQRLREEIVLTHEVRECAQDWKNNGALLFAISDKPDEASLPTPEQSARGLRPIHHTRTHVVGE